MLLCFPCAILCVNKYLYLCVCSKKFKDSEFGVKSKEKAIFTSFSFCFQVKKTLHLIKSSICTSR